METNTFFKMNNHSDQAVALAFDLLKNGKSSMNIVEWERLYERFGGRVIQSEWKELYHKTHFEWGKIALLEKEFFNFPLARQAQFCHAFLQRHSEEPRGLLSILPNNIVMRGELRNNLALINFFTETNLLSSVTFL